MSKITKEQLNEITDWLKWHIFRNRDVMFAEDCETEKGDQYYDLIDIIASLHNLLCEAIEGERYDYMFHWANKIGSDCSDDFFDDIMNGDQGNERKGD